MKETGLRRIDIVYIIGLWLIALGLSVIIHNRAWQGMVLTFIESLIYLIFLIFLSSIRPIRRYFAKIPGAHELIFITFFILLLVGQLVNQTSLTFPFTSWAMYGKPEHPEVLVFYRCLGIDEKQNKHTIDTEAFFPFADKSTVASKFKKLVSKAFTNDNLSVQREYQKKLIEWLLAIGQIYNRQHPEDPIRSVELQKCTLNLNYSDKPKVLRESLIIVDLGIETLQ
jgi:hypothetical protein